MRHSEAQPLSLLHDITLSFHSPYQGIVINSKYVENCIVTKFAGSKDVRRCCGTEPTIWRRFHMSCRWQD